MPKLTVVLDVDETLLHASDVELKREPDFMIYGYYVYLRPHLREFLDYCTSCYQTAIWSSGGESYVNSVVEQAYGRQKFTAIWDRSRCTAEVSAEASMGSYGLYSNPCDTPMEYVKKLRKMESSLGFDLDSTVIVDDTPQKYRHNYGNGIYADPWYGKGDDTFLLDLKRYLSLLNAQVESGVSVRTIDKRDWRIKMKNSGGF